MGEENKMYPETCDICHDHKPFVKNYEDGKYYCLDCAFIAGNPDAMQIKAQQHATDFLERALTPAIETEGVQ